MYIVLYIVAVKLRAILKSKMYIIAISLMIFIKIISRIGAYR